MHFRPILLAAALLATQSAIGANASICSTVRINGNHPLRFTCADGSCGIYSVDDFAAPDTDLGFGGPGADVIEFEFYKTGGIPELGTFDLASATNNNYAYCEQCVLVYQDFDGVQLSFSKVFFQTSGTLTVNGAAVPGVAPDLSLIWSNLHLVEVTIDPNTFVSTPVSNGACYDALPEVIFANSFQPLI